MTVEAFPLQWPVGRPRTPTLERENGRFDTSFARARDNIVREVGLLCGRYAPDPRVVISTNIALRRDGLPLAGQRQPIDPAVAVYFTYNGRQVSFACDRWCRIEHNMQAIAKTIEALRGLSRWGTGDMVAAAFTGFEALPPPGAVRTWREVIGVPPGERDMSAVRAAFRRRAQDAHPDRGGSHDDMAALNVALRQAEAELTGATA